MKEKREAVIDAGGGELIQFNDFLENKPEKLVMIKN